MNEAEIARARRWKAFYDEESGLKDILASLRTAYLERMGGVEPWETDKLVKLSVASKVVVAIDSEIQSIIAAGRIAEQHNEHLKRIDKLPAAKKRWLSVSPG